MDSEVLNIHESLSGSFFYFTFILVVATALTTEWNGYLVPHSSL